MRTRSQQCSYFLAFIVVLLCLAGASYLQFYKGVNPCPLCILQRFVMGMLGIIFLLGTAFSFKRCTQVILSSATILVSLLGILLSGRQLWLQHLPPATGENCEASLQYMLQVLPWHEVARNVFQGGTSCSQVEWQLMHVSLAGWSLMAFVVFLIFGLRQIKHRKKSN